VGGETGECLDPIALHENAVGGPSCVLMRSQEGGEKGGAPRLAEFTEFMRTVMPLKLSSQHEQTKHTASVVHDVRPFERDSPLSTPLVN
jgi:hypothetical protein